MLSLQTTAGYTLYEASEGGVTEQSKKYFNQSRGKN
jgi:hypothetical protein